MDAILSAAQSTTGQVVVPLTPGNTISLLLITEAALLSQITVAILLLYVLFNAIRNHVRPPAARGLQPWRFIRTATDYYFFNLLFMDLIQALGSILDIRWIHKQHVEGGSTYCSAQGFIKQFGNVGVALSTFVIAVHTFAVLFLRWRVPDTKLLPLGVIGLIWLFLILATSIPWSTKDDYYYQTGSWCWINSKYGNLQYGLEYYIMWIVAFSGFLLYIPLFIRLRRTIRSYPEHSAQQMHIARQLLVYPIAYVIVITPISVVRKIQFTNTKNMANLVAQGKPTSGKPAVDPGLVGFAGVAFGLSGFVNTILYIITRPSILVSFLSIFQPNRDGGAAPPPAGAAHGRRRKPAENPATTIPEVTIDDGFGRESDSREAAMRGDHEVDLGSAQRPDQRSFEDTDYGLPTVTVMSEHHLTPPSLLTRGTVASYGNDRSLTVPSNHRQASSSSSVGTKYQVYYPPKKEGTANIIAYGFQAHLDDEMGSRRRHRGRGNDYSSKVKT
ncbi:hypothetical protein FRC04_007091 [Tulasnella sp. 424]|nr:hypothetical protein FRC04_007091 [Tulasnella sp. 424]KAG8976886.1 hypothetical protein FRC05_002823 [Tulasnella sp. 425]